MGFVCSKTNCPVDSLEYMVNVGAVSRPNENIVPAGSTGGKHFRIADGYDHAIGGNAFFSVAVDTFQFQGKKRNEGTVCFINTILAGTVAAVSVRLGSGETFPDKFHVVCQHYVIKAQVNGG